MCTIMTFSKELFNANQEKIIAQIRVDALSNRDGYSLILAGPEESNATLIQTMQIEQVITLLTTATFTRFWLHCRASTTNACNLAGCHGFRAGDTHWLVMHNGIIPEGTKKHRVDSMAISARLGLTEDITDTIEWLTSLRYANVFLVNPVTGEWYVTRGDGTGGTLHCDEAADSFSTKHIPGLCDFVLTDNSYVEHKIKITPKYEPKFSDWKARSFTSKEIRETEKAYNEALLRSLSGCTSQDAVADVLDTVDCVTYFDIPWEVRTKLSKQVINWIEECIYSNERKVINNA